MEDLLHETTLPLAWDHEGMPFQPPSEAVAWKVRRYTGNRGRPPIVFGQQGPLHIELDATMDDLRLALGDEHGSYRLYPVNEAGTELEPVACVEVKPVENGQEITVLGLDKEEAPRRGTAQTADSAAMELCRMMATSRDEHDKLMTNMLTALVQSTATIQQSMAGLLSVATNTIKVANGLDAVERLPSSPELDIDTLASTLVDAFKNEAEEENSEDKKSWIELLMKSPLMPTMMQFITGLAQGMQQTRAANTTEAKPQTTQTHTENEVGDAEDGTEDDQ